MLTERNKKTWLQKSLEKGRMMRESTKTYGLNTQTKRPANVILGVMLLLDRKNSK